MSNEVVTERLWSKRQKRPARKGSTFAPLWCTACARLVWMVSLEEAAALVSTSVEILNRRIENRTLHCMKPSAETLLICCDSLL